MLGKHTVITTIPVQDLENGELFYHEILGLKIVERNFAGIVMESMGGMLAIHQSLTAGRSPSTCAWWTVDDVEASVKELKKKGVAFVKNYDLPRAKRKGEIYYLNEYSKAAWFTDPDGNILGFGNF